MATQKLLNTLAFRSIKASTTSIASISVKFGSSREQGHTSARKFFKNYLPIILYHNPDIKAQVEKYKSSSSASSTASSSSTTPAATTSPTTVPDPLIVVTKTDGSTVEYNLKNVIADLQKQVTTSSSSSSPSSSSTPSITSKKQKLSPKALEPDTWIFQQLTGSTERLPDSIKRSNSGNNRKKSSGGSKPSSSSSTTTENNDDKDNYNNSSSSSSATTNDTTSKVTESTTSKKEASTAAKAKK